MANFDFRNQNNVICCMWIITKRKMIEICMEQDNQNGNIPFKS